MVGDLKIKIHLVGREIEQKPAAKNSIRQGTAAKIMKEAKEWKEEHFAQPEKCNSTKENQRASMTLCSWKYYSNCYLWHRGSSVQWAFLVFIQDGAGGGILIKGQCWKHFQF